MASSTVRSSASTEMTMASASGRIRASSLIASMPLPSGRLRSVMRRSSGLVSMARTVDARSGQTATSSPPVQFSTMPARRSRTGPSSSASTIRQGAPSLRTVSAATVEQSPFLKSLRSAEPTPINRYSQALHTRCMVWSTSAKARLPERERLRTPKELSTRCQTPLSAARGWDGQRS